MRMLGKDSPLLGVAGKQERDSIVDGEDSGAILAGKGCFQGRWDSNASTLFRGGPAEGLVRVRATELGKEAVDPGGVRCCGHDRSTAAGWGGCKERWGLMSAGVVVGVEG